MRESIAKTITPAVRPTLESVSSQFEAWRKRKRPGRRIPEALWQSAVALCRDHSVCDVSRTLRVNYNDLKHHLQEVKVPGLGVPQSTDFGFVRLDLGAAIASPECCVEMEAPDGARMRMSFKGIPRDVDPVDLVRAFWRQGE